MRRVFELCFMVTLGSIIWSSTAIATKSVKLPRNNMIGLRPMAMGDAFTTVADDHNALYYNPAGLARIQSFSMEVLNGFFGTNSNVVDSSQKIQDSLGKLGGSSTAANLEAASTLLRSIQGNNHWLRYGFNPNFVMQNFGFALMFANELNATINEPLPEFMDIALDVDVDARFGYAREIFGPKLSVGAALAFRQRISLDESLSTDFLDKFLNGQDRLQEELKDLIKSGQGIGLDLGMLYSPSTFMKPTFGLAVQNLGGLHFKESSLFPDLPSSKPSSVPQEVRAGFSVEPQFGAFYVRGSMDVHKMNLPYPSSEKVKFGVETGIGNHFRVQVGLSNGFVSGGFETRLWVLNLRLATYGSEAGYYAGQKPERRYIAGAKLFF